MEQYNEKEFQRTFRGKVNGLVNAIDGRIIFTVNVQNKKNNEEIISLELSPGLQQKLDVKDRLSDGMDIIITTDMDGHVLSIERILH